MKSFAMVILTSFILLSCANSKKGVFVHKTNEFHPENLPIRAFVDKNHSNEHFKLVNIHFENQSNEWIYIEGAKVLTINNKKVVSIPTTKDSMSWKESFVESRRIEDHNVSVGKASAYGLLAILAVAGAVNGNAELAYGSLGAMHVATGVEAVSHVSQSATELENAKLKYENHLYSEAKIFPGMIKRRWVLVQVNKNERICKMDFNIKYKNTKPANYTVDLCRRT